jgi:hypothetical protein
MITQAIKRWLRNMFAWWPWKHTPPETYRQASGPLGMNASSQEGISRSTVEGTTQSSITPRLSTIEERPEHTISAPKSASNDITETPLPPSLRLPAESVTESSSGSASPAASPAPSAPTPQQRLEFLRYLVERGIINEGSEEL